MASLYTFGAGKKSRSSGCRLLNSRTAKSRNHTKVQFDGIPSCTLVWLPAKSGRQSASRIMAWRKRFSGSASPYLGWWRISLCPSGGPSLRLFQSLTPAGGSRTAAIGFEGQLLATSYWLLAPGLPSWPSLLAFSSWLLPLSPSLDPASSSFLAMSTRDSSKTAMSGFAFSQKPAARS